MKNDSDSLDSITSVVLPKRPKPKPPYLQESQDEQHKVLEVLIFATATMLWISGIGIIVFTAFLFGAQPTVLIVPKRGFYLSCMSLQAVAGLGTLITAWLTSCCHNMESKMVPFHSKVGIVILSLTSALLAGEIILIFYTKNQFSEKLHKDLKDLMENYDLEFNSKSHSDEIQHDVGYENKDKCLNWNDVSCYAELKAHCYVNLCYMTGTASILIFLLLLAFPVLTIAYKTGRKEMSGKMKLRSLLFGCVPNQTNLPEKTFKLNSPNQDEWHTLNQKKSFDLK